MRYLGIELSEGDIEEMIEEILEHEDKLSKWELNFMDEMSRFEVRTHDDEPSVNQLEKLAEIHAKYVH